MCYEKNVKCWLCTFKLLINHCLNLHIYLSYNVSILLFLMNVFIQINIIIHCNITLGLPTNYCIDHVGKVVLFSRFQIRLARGAAGSRLTGWVNQIGHYAWPRALPFSIAVVGQSSCALRTSHVFKNTNLIHILIAHTY